jgi:hypothetical protein
VISRSFPAVEITPIIIHKAYVSTKLPDCGAWIVIGRPHVQPCCCFAAGKRSDDIVQMKKEVMTVINKQMAKSGAAAAADDGGCSPPWCLYAS